MMIKQTNNTNEYQATQRTNNFISSSKSNQLIHIFTKQNVLSPHISLLKNQCKKRSIPVLIHENPRELITLINDSSSKIFIVIETPRQLTQKSSYVFPETFSFPKITDNNIKVISYPFMLVNTKYQTAKDKIQVMNLYEKFFSNNQSHEGKKIRLKKVSSSKDVKYQFVSPTTKKLQSQKKLKSTIIFQKLLINQHNLNPTSQFNNLSKSFKENTERNIHKIYKQSDIKDHISSLNEKHKLLMLVDDVNLNQILSYLQKSNVTKKIDMIIFGELKQPNKQLLLNNIIFASNNGLEIFDQLERMGFSRMKQSKTIYSNLLSLSGKGNNNINQIDNDNKFIMVSQKQIQLNKSTSQNDHNNISSNTTPRFQRPEMNRISDRSKHSIFSNGSSQQQRFMRNWIIERDPKNTNSFIQYEQSRQQIQSQSVPMSLRASRITKRNTSSQSQVSIFKAGMNVLEDQTKLRKQKQTPSLRNLNNHHQIVDQFSLDNHEENKMMEMKKEMTFSEGIAYHHNKQSGVAGSEEKKVDTNVNMNNSMNNNVKKVLKLTKKTIQNQTPTFLKSNYQMPSNVIHETSQQHRGSNRESNINMQQNYINLGSVNILGSALNIQSTGVLNKMKGSNLQSVVDDEMKKIIPKSQIITLKLQSNDQLTNQIRNSSVRVINDKQTLPVIQIIQQKSQTDVKGASSNDLINTKNQISKSEQRPQKQYDRRSQYDSANSIEVHPYISDNNDNQIQNSYGYNNITSVNNNNDSKSYGYDKSSIPFQMPERSIPEKIRMNLLQEDSLKISNCSDRNIARNVLGYENVRHNIPIMMKNVEGQVYKIDGLTGELDLESFKRFNDNIIVPSFSSGSQLKKISHKESVVSSSIQQQQQINPRSQVVRISKHIPPQIVHSSVLISTATINTNNNIMIVENDHHKNQQSGTSIKLPQGTQGYDKKFGDDFQQNNDSERIVSTTKKINADTAKYNHPSKYGYQDGNGDKKQEENLKATKDVKEMMGDNYVTRRYQSNYYNGSRNPVQVNQKYYTLSSPSNIRRDSYTIQSNKQPEVIERIYIKASDLPERKNKMQGRTIISSGSKNQENQKQQNSKPQPVIRENQKFKLTRQDLDPFHEKPSQLLGVSKLSKSKKGSYMKRKQDGVRDPFSSYEEKGSHLSPHKQSKQHIKQTKQTNSVRTYTAEEYQKILAQRQRDTKSPSASNQFYIPKLSRNTEERTFVTSPVREVRVEANGRIHGFNLDQMEKVNENGIVVYKQKARPSMQNNEHLIEKRYMTSHLPRDSNYKLNSIVNGYQNVLTRYEPTGREYANSPTRKQGSSYEKGLKIQNPLRRPTQTNEQKINPLKAKQEYIQPMIYKERSPMKIIQYKPQQVYTYQSPMKHVYQRHEIVQPRVQASNFNPRIDSKDADKVIERNDNQIAGTNSDRFSETIDLSDGSIMRRNNIKFGVNKYKKKDKKMQESYYLSQMKSKIRDRTVQMSALRNIEVKKTLHNAEDISKDKQHYFFINTSVNSFHFLIDEDLRYLQDWVKQNILTKNDRIEIFRGVDELYDKMMTNSNDQFFDAGFIFPKNEELNKINRKQITEDYFMVEIKSDDFKGLEISSKYNLVKLSKLSDLRHVQKVVLQPKLTNIILCQKPQISSQKSEQNKIMTLFPDAEFQKEFYDEPLKFQTVINIIDEPILSRLYIICNNQKQISNIQSLLKQLQEAYSVPKQIFHIICLSDGRTPQYYNNNIITILSDPSLRFAHYKQILKLTFNQSSTFESTKKSQHQKIFYYYRHKNQIEVIQKEFPSRFEFSSFNSVNQVEQKVSKSMNYKNSLNYLILHPLLSDEYIDTEYFKKIFMLGKSERVQKKVVRVSNSIELVQLLRN